MKESIAAQIEGNGTDGVWGAEVQRLKGQRDDYARRLAEVTAERDGLAERIGSYGPVLNALEAINNAGQTWNIQVDPKPDASQ